MAATPASEPMRSLAFSVRLAAAVSRFTATVSASAEPFDKAKLPALTVAAPVKVLEPDSVKVPLPCLVKPPMPPITPA